MTSPHRPDYHLDQLRQDLDDEYDVHRLLGEGSTSTVYLARERALGRLVAIKVLKQGKARDETARRRFEREGRAAASISEHPDVVAVYHFGQLPDDTPFLVMRYVKGRTMEDRLQAEGRLPIEHACQALSSVASALAEAHERAIVHRDVRPNNVMWDDEAERPYLSDFGIAAMLGADSWEATRLTATGEMVGDPRYLSPEQLTDHDLTEQSDIYGYGVMGYELLTGEGPYEAKTIAEWIEAHLTQEPRDLLALRPDAPAYLADLLRRCLAKNPSHRPSASDIVRILRSGEESLTRTGVHGADADLGELVRRRVPQLVALALTVGVTLVGLVGAGVEFYGLRRIVLDLTIVLSVAGVLVALVGSWYHGESGRQKPTAIEWLLYGAIAVVWLGVSGYLILR